MSKARFFTLPQRVRGVIFDCDGVILNSRAANARYYNMILDALGLPPLTQEQEAYTYMATVHQSLEYITPPALHARLPEVCRDTVNYRRDIMPYVELEPGLMDFVRWLQSCGVRMGIHTNRSSGMPHVLDTFGLHTYFDPVMTAAVVPPKPHPDGVLQTLAQWDLPKGDIIFIGDSPMDAQTARAADVPFVAYGGEALDAAVQVDTFEALAALLQQRVAQEATSEAR